MLAAVFTWWIQPLSHQGIEKRRSLNSRFFQPVVSIPHASLEAKCSSSALPFQAPWQEGCYIAPGPFHAAFPLRLCLVMEPFHHSALIVHSLPALIPLWHLLPEELQWTCFEKRGQLVIQTVKWMSSLERASPQLRIQKIKYAINLFWSGQSFGVLELFDIRLKNITCFCSASIVN